MSDSETVRDHSVGHDRPNLEPGHHSGSFRSRALAVSAAHRMASPRSMSPTGPAANASPSGGRPIPTVRLPPPAAGHFSTSPLSPTAGTGLGVSPQRNYGSFTNDTGPQGPPFEGAGSRTPTVTSPTPDVEARAGLSPTSVHFAASPDGTALDDRSSDGGFSAAHEEFKAKYHWLSSDDGTVNANLGDEPGVDVRSKRDEEAYSHLKGKTNVTVVDYSSDPDDGSTNLRVEFAGERLGEFLRGDVGARRTDDDGKPTGVRWLHIDGINWEVIKTLTLHYGLHPLSVEDALRSGNSPRSKLDFYKSHLYLQILVQHMHPQDELDLRAAAEGLATTGAVDRAVPTVGSGSAVGGPFAVESSHERRPSAFDRRRSSVSGSGGAGLGRRGSMYGGLPPRRSTLDKIKDAFGGSTKTMRLPEGVEGVFEPTLSGSRLQGGESPYQKAAHRLTVDQLSAKYMVPIRRGILSVFMLRDGTIITLARKPINEVLQPIYDRLEDEQSLLRRSGDPSMLSQAILDTSVDLAIEVSQTFEAEILKVEASVLVDPQMETVRHLHVLSSQLIRLRRSLTPLLHICYIIRDQDNMRSAAASAMSGGRGSARSSLPQRGSSASEHNGYEGMAGIDRLQPGLASFGMTPQNVGAGTDDPPGFNIETASVRSATPSMATFAQNGQPAAHQDRVGFFSPMTKVYIGDVLDHLELVVGSMDQFVATCEHLTDYVFNVMSFQMNSAMERLSIVTVVFLPLTFISSYFGMNFTDFPEIEQSVRYFWKVAAPSTFMFFLIFSFGYIRNGLETGFRRIGRWRRTRALEQRVRAQAKTKTL